MHDQFLVPGTRYQVLVRYTYGKEDVETCILRNEVRFVTIYLTTYKFYNTERIDQNARKYHKR